MKQFVISGAVLGLMLAGTSVRTANADDNKPMFGLGKNTKPCDTVISASGDAKAKCKAAGTKNIPGFGKVTLWAAGNIKTGVAYAVSVEGADTHNYIGPTILITPDSGMQKEDVAKSVAAKLRVINKKYLGVEIVTKREFTSNADKKVQKWTKFEYQVCKANESGINCWTREYGTPGGACTASITDAGVLSHGCQEIEDLGQ